jgi:hypothetical protein
MTSPAPNQSSKNAAPTAHRIDLFVGGLNRLFLTVSLGQNLGDNRHPINRGRWKPQETQHARGDLRPLHHYSTVGNNTFRKGISAHTRSC